MVGSLAYFSSDLCSLVKKFKCICCENRKDCEKRKSTNRIRNHFLIKFGFVLICSFVELTLISNK